MQIVKNTTILYEPLFDPFVASATFIQEANNEKAEPQF